MKRHARLQGRGRFSQIYREGSTWSHRLLVLKVLPNGLPESRFGFAVGKALGGAVVRNHLRRRLREIVRHTPICPNRDAIFIARAGAAGAAFSELAEAASELLGRSGLKAEK
jgi:ribonuclease P protein component